MSGLLVAVIFVGLIILILLFVGQAFYNKFPKVSYTIWGLTVLFLLYFVYSFNTANTRLGDKSINDYIGTYKIDTNSSSYDNIDLTNYYNLTLTVKTDKTFEFSYKTPFFKDTIGHWQHMDDGDISWTEISIGDRNLMQANIDTNKWTFSGHALPNGSSRDKLIFVRR